MCPDRLRRLILPATVALVLASFAWGVPPAFAVYPGTDGRIAFTANLNGKTWQLYTMSPDGTDRRKLTHIHGSQDVSNFPDWSPDGKRIVFNTTVGGILQLFIIRANGTGMHLLFSDPKRDDYLAKWSPAGDKIVFSRGSRTGNSGLWTIRPGGGGLTRITGARVDHAGAEYTPDGSKILFDRSGGGEIAAIWSVDADGSNPEQLTPTQMRAGLFDISPDGSKVVFYDGQNGPLPNSLWTMNIGGTAFDQLTDASCCFHDVGPGYSPDGSRILFTTDRNYPRECCEELWVMHPDGSHPFELTSNLTVDGCPELGNCSFSDWGPAQT